MFLVIAPLYTMDPLHTRTSMMSTDTCSKSLEMTPVRGSTHTDSDGLIDTLIKSFFSEQARPSYSMDSAVGHPIGKKPPEYTLVRVYSAIGIGYK